MGDCKSAFSKKPFLCTVSCAFYFHETVARVSTIYN